MSTTTMTPEDFATEVITCWIPLVDVNEAMGSLQIHPNVAKDERLLDTGGTPEKPRGGLIVPEALPPEPPLDEHAVAFEWMGKRRPETTARLCSQCKLILILE